MGNQLILLLGGALALAGYELWANRPVGGRSPIVLAVVLTIIAVSIDAIKALF